MKRQVLFHEISTNPGTPSRTMGRYNGTEDRVDSDGDPVAFRHFVDRVTVRVAYVVEAGVYVIKTVVCRPERSK
jgi:hypothetical protein